MFEARTMHQKDWSAHLKSAFIGLGTGAGFAKAADALVTAYGPGRLPDWMALHPRQVGATVGLASGLVLWKLKGPDHGGVAVVAALLYGLEPIVEGFLTPRIEAVFDPPVALQEPAELPQEATAEVIPLGGVRGRR